MSNTQARCPTLRFFSAGKLTLNPTQSQGSSLPFRLALDPFGPVKSDPRTNCPDPSDRRAAHTSDITIEVAMSLAL
jgi:hypothetical protein